MIVWLIDVEGSADESSWKVIALFVPGAYSGPILAIDNLVDPASSHMLVSKIKPCMSKFRNCERLIKTVIVHMMVLFRITLAILELIHVFCTY